MISANELPQPPHNTTTDGGDGGNGSQLPVTGMPTSYRAPPSPAQSEKINSVTAPSSAPGVQLQAPDSQVQHIWVVTGPAGCGKSTVGGNICQQLGLPFLEGDDVCGDILDSKLLLTIHTFILCCSTPEGGFPFKLTCGVVPSQKQQRKDGRRHSSDG